MNLGAILTLGFLLGMRHATDADHVVAVTAIVSRERSLRAAAPLGILWGVGHTLTILLVGGAIIVFGVVIPPHVGLAMEFAVGLMLVLLGGLNVRSVIRDRTLGAVRTEPPQLHAHLGRLGRGRAIRPVAIGVVHGLAGSAAIALLVLGAIHDALLGIGYLLVFGIGTIAGMFLITTAFAASISAATRRFERLYQLLGVLTGLGSILFGLVLVYEIGFVHGLFSARPQWTPQ